MKTLRNLLLSVILLSNGAIIPASLPVLGTLEEAGKQLLPVELEKKKAEQLESLKKEKQQLEAAKKDFTEHIKDVLNGLNMQTDAVKSTLEIEPDNDFFVKDLSLLNQRQQVL